MSKLKQANLKLATRVEQLEHSCLEKVKKKQNTFNLGLPANGDPCARLALLAGFPHGRVWGELGWSSTALPAPPWAAPPQRNHVPTSVLLLWARLCCFPAAGDALQH